MNWLQLSLQVLKKISESQKINLSPCPGLICLSEHCSRRHGNVKASTVINTMVNSQTLGCRAHLWKVADATQNNL